MQIKVKPIGGHRYEIRLDKTRLVLDESDCREMRDALSHSIETFSRYPSADWEEARTEFQQLLPALEHLEKFTDNDLALLIREFDFVLLYRVCQNRPMTTLLKKLETALGRKEIDRLVVEGERLPLKPLWEVNLRMSALVRTIERMKDEGEIKPPPMPDLTRIQAAAKLSHAPEASFIRQVLNKLDGFPDKALMAVFRQTPPRELAKLWLIIEELPEGSMPARFNQLIPENTRDKLHPAKPSSITPADAKKTAQLIVDVVKNLQNKKPSTPPPSGPVLT
ncbi:hypothetical protein [Oceanospirillum sediminis]|uniref:Uncharacterized protein n=1 Tax=Oceanospirillum sediminis TaxID=2760088 RepID=A0A839IL50_9GAMM|nr:hypothetical protein [Oceanospirillum sediminis]MBB1485217.1 hypothetical protein [Oceanospirillum sediminis]